MIKRCVQSTYEGCLACCLSQAVDRIKPIKINQKIELDCINHSLKFSKYDFVMGHLDFISKKFKLPIKRIVDHKEIYNFLQTLNFSGKIKTEVKKVNLKLIDKYLDKKPIIALDFYYLFRGFPFHYPHFITLLGKKEDTYHIYDTWDGKEKYIESDMLSEAIHSLRDYILFSPELIFLDVDPKNSRVSKASSGFLIDRIKNSLGNHKSLIK